MRIYNFGLLVLICLIGVLHTLLRTNPEKIQIQAESALINSLAFPNSESEIDFLPLEKIVWQHEFGKNKKGLVGSHTFDWLEAIYAHLESTGQLTKSERRSFLISKIYPGVTGKKLSNLIDDFIIYQQWFKDRERSVEWGGSDQPIQAVENLLSDMKAEQQKMFAEEAQALFAKSNLSYAYLVRSKLVRMDNALSLHDKKLALAELRKKYENDMLLQQQYESNLDN